MVIYGVEKTRSHMFSCYHRDRRRQAVRRAAQRVNRNTVLHTGEVRLSLSDVNHPTRYSPVDFQCQDKISSLRQKAFSPSLLVFQMISHTGRCSSKESYMNTHSWEAKCWGLFALQSNRYIGSHTERDLKNMCSRLGKCCLYFSSAWKRNSCFKQWVFINSLFTYLFCNVYLLSSYYVPRIGLSVGDKRVSKTKHPNSLFSASWNV